MRTDDDLWIEGSPITLTRTYRTRDTVARPFGIGTSHSYNLYLIGDGETFQSGEKAGWSSSAGESWVRLICVCPPALCR